MKAMIFAAGRGERMQPLTDHTPKPLLEVGGRALIEHHLDKIAAIGIRDVIINVSWLSDQIIERLGDGSRYGVRITWSREPGTPRETGGGLLQALPLLGDAPFLLVNADIWIEHDFATLPDEPPGFAHLVLIDNPPHHPQGDFWLHADGLLTMDERMDKDTDLVRSQEPLASRCLTYAGLGVYRPQLLSGWRGIIGHAPGAREQPPRFPIAPLLRAAMRERRITGEHFRGHWTDVGTPARLDELRTALTRKSARARPQPELDRTVAISPPSPSC